MISNIQILLAIATAATSSFLQTPSNQLETTFNSTFLASNERLFQPIIIPNITKHPETKPTEDSTQVSTTIGNSHKFSSRYSTKYEETTTTELPTGEPSDNEEVSKLISNRSDSFESEEDKKDLVESEETENEPTTEISYRKETEETDSSEENEEKRSIEDYYNSGSKNYHSIQTPLDRIKYQGPHSFTDDRKRIVAPIIRHSTTPNWPYSKPQIKTELENSNEISEENYEKELDDEMKTPKLLLKAAEEKDRQKFDRSKKYNYIELRNQRMQQQKALIAEEEKDDQKPLFQSFRQYQVDEEEPSQAIFSFKSWSTTRPPAATPKDNIRPIFYKNPPNHQFQGPVVFNHKSYEEATRNIFPKGLKQSEKLDQEKLTNERRQKTVFRSGIAQSFDHLKESDEMYNAILANIQSVFGLRTQPLKSAMKSVKGFPDVNLEESKALTWSLPLKKTD